MMKLSIVAVALCVFAINQGVDAARKPRKPGYFLSRCFGKTVLAEGALDNQSPTENVSDLSCNFDTPCQSWGPSEGNWAVAGTRRGRFPAGRLRKCFAEGAAPTPTEQFLFTELQESWRSATLTSAKLSNVKSLTLDVRSWDQNADIDICVQGIKAGEPVCKPIAESNKLIEDTGDVYCEVEVSIVAKFTGDAKRGGMIVLDDITATGETDSTTDSCIDVDAPIIEEEEEEEAPLEDVMYECDHVEDEGCSAYEFGEWTQRDDDCCNFDHGVRKENNESPHWWTAHVPTQQKMVMSIDNAAQATGTLKFSRYLATNNAYIDVCSDEAMTNCFAHIGKEQVSLGDLSWISEEIQIDQPTDKIYIACDNQSPYEAHCGLDHFKLETSINEAGSDV